MWDGAIGSGSFINITTSFLAYANLSTYGWANRISNIEWSTDSAIQNNYIVVAYKNNNLVSGVTSATDAWTFQADMDTSMSTYGFNNNINSIEAIYYPGIRTSACILYRDSLGSGTYGGGKQMYCKAYRNCNDLDSTNSSPF